METKSEETKNNQFEEWFNHFTYKDELIKLGFDKPYELLLLNTRSLDRIYQEIPPKYAAEVEREANLNKNVSTWNNSKDDMLVNVCLWIESISNIDEINESVELDFYVRYNWYQEHLKTLKYSDGDSLPENIIENHMIYIDNDINLQIIGNPKLILEEKETGLIRHVIRYKGNIKTHMDYHSFPLDTQNVPIMFQSIKGNIKYETGDWYTNNPKKGGDKQFKSEGYEYNLNDGHENQATQQYIFSISATRSNHQYYFWNIIVLLYIITNFSLLSYGISYDDYSSRFSNDITLLLTIIAFLLTVKATLPRINYLTLLDKYILLCFAFQIVITLEHFLISIMSYSDEGKQTFETIFYSTVFIMWFVLHLLCVYYFFK